ncbi:hypothetical protein C8J56DRAFT_34608 [Mycena floridula]|nr:hypothetical protein C8J56DRAFT_34608 [Mycena floridula]
MVAAETHVKRGHPIMFAVLVLFAAFELSVSAWLTSRFAERGDQSNQSEADRVHLLLFTSAFTIFISLMFSMLFYQAPTGSVLTSVASHFVVLTVSWVLWTSGAASITHLLKGGLNCSLPHQEYVYCHQLNALEGFAWICWALNTAMLVGIVIRGVHAVRRGDGYRGSLV